MPIPTYFSRSQSTLLANESRADTQTLRTPNLILQSEISWSVRHRTKRVSWTQCPLRRWKKCVNLWLHLSPRCSFKEDNNRQATTSVKRCCTSRPQHQDQGLSWLMHQELHWLDIPERENYKLGVLTHWCLLGKAPVYLSNCCIPVKSLHGGIYAPLHVISWPYLDIVSALTVGGHLLSLVQRCSTLPDDLWNPAIITSTFGQLLKTHLFSAYQHV